MPKRDDSLPWLVENRYIASTELLFFVVCGGEVFECTCPSIDRGSFAQYVDVEGFCCPSAWFEKPTSNASVVPELDADGNVGY